MTESQMEKSMRQSVRLFGNEFNVVSATGLINLIAHHITNYEGRALRLAHHNLHSLALCRTNQQMQDYINATEAVWLDGMPLVWMLQRLKYKIDRTWRITFLDFDKVLFEHACRKKWNIFLLGTTQELNTRALENIAQHYAGISLAGHHGYIFGESKRSSNQTAIKQINDFKTDILIVAMGMPLQETWIAEHTEQLDCKVIMPVGGYLDYLAGETYTPPRWAGAIGLEWVFRLLSNPVRLWQRYLIEPWPVIFMFFKELRAR